MILNLLTRVDASIRAYLVENVPPQPRFLSARGVWWNATGWGLLSGGLELIQVIVIPLLAHPTGPVPDGAEAKLRFIVDLCVQTPLVETAALLFVLFCFTYSGSLALIGVFLTAGFVHVFPDVLQLRFAAWESVRFVLTGATFVVFALQTINYARRHNLLTVFLAVAFSHGIGNAIGAFFIYLTLV